MDRRIQQALDGEIARDDLTRDAALQLAATEAVLSRVVASIPDDPLPDLSEAVLQRIRAARAREVGTAPTQARAPGSRARGALDGFRWLWTPKPLQWRPVYGFAAAAGLALAIIGTAAVDSPQPEIGPAPAGPAQVFVQFRLEAPQASQVLLAGDFTEWQPSYVLSRSVSGVWSVVVPLEPGVHEYAFVVDGGQWVPDPLAPAVSDGFGGVNSRLAVLTPDTPRPL